MKQKHDLLKAFEKKKTEGNEVKAEFISKLHGIIALRDGLFTLDKSFIIPFSNSESMQILKQYRLYSKNYANMFQIKAKVLVDILNNLLIEYSAQTVRLFQFFKLLRSHIKKKLQGMPLTEADIHHMNYIKYFLADFDMEVNTRDDELKEIIELLGEGDEKSVRPGFMTTIRGITQSYINSVSLLIHRIEKDKLPHAQLSIQFSSSEGNPSLLEFLMLITFETFRKFTLEVAVPKIFDLHKRFQGRIGHGAKLAEHFYSSYPSVFGTLEPLNFRLSTLIEPTLKRYIKTKIGLEPKIILKDEDLREFFDEKFEFKYPDTNPFWVSFLNVFFENTRTKELTPFLLTLDVPYL